MPSQRWGSALPDTVKARDIAPELWLFAGVRVEHEVKLADFTKWLEKTGGSSPRELTQRQRIRVILGMPVAR
jgi:hypothetical protein